MINLSDLIEKIPTKMGFLCFPSHETTVDHLVNRSLAFRNFIIGKKIAVCTDNLELGLTALLAADGYSKSICLLPDNLKKEEKKKILNLIDYDLIIEESFQVECNVNLRKSNLANRIITDWQMLTSGTTNIPKVISHTLQSLSRATNQKVINDKTVKWGLMYEFFRFAGLQVLIQALHNRVTLIVPDRSLPLQNQIKMLADNGCTHLSATPTFWRSIVMTAECKSLKLRQITLGGEIADAKILDSLSAIYPLAKITHIYASTETGVAFSVKDGLPGFPEYYLNKSINGLSFRIYNGMLQIKNKESTNQSEDCWIDTGDLVECKESRIFFKGRAQCVINVGGNKVHPEEIESALLSISEIQGAIVYPKTNPITGFVVAAEVLPYLHPKDTVKFSSNIRDYLSTKLDAYKIPALIKVVKSLKINASGKMNRTSL